MIEGCEREAKEIREIADATQKNLESDEAKLAHIRAFSGRMIRLDEW